MVGEEIDSVRKMTRGQFPWDIEMVVQETLSDDEDGVPDCDSDSHSHSDSDSDSD